MAPPTLAHIGRPIRIALPVVLSMDKADAIGTYPNENPTCTKFAPPRSRREPSIYGLKNWSGCRERTLMQLGKLNLFKYIRMIAARNHQTVAAILQNHNAAG